MKSLAPKYKWRNRGLRFASRECHNMYWKDLIKSLKKLNPSLLGYGLEGVQNQSALDGKAGTTIPAKKYIWGTNDHTT